jgi:hypothetical protein
MAAKEGSNVLFRLPNRTRFIILLSVYERISVNLRLFVCAATRRCGQIECALVLMQPHTSLMVSS